MTHGVVIASEAMNGEPTLSEAFLRAAPTACLGALRALPDLEARLDALVTRARQAHPTLAFEPVDFLGYLAARLPLKGDLGATLEGVRAEDLLLAFACVGGQPLAHALLEREVFSQVGGWFPGEDAAVIAEIGQRLRQRLLLTEGGSPPRLATFSGRATLTRWARAIALRLLADIRREQSDHVPLDDAGPEAEVMVGRDAELSFIRGRYQEPFRLALLEALAALTPRERNLLRLHHVDNLSVDSVGTMYQTSRSTAARWIAQAREHLIQRTREALASRLDLESEELESLLGLLRSHVDISLHRLLQS